LYFKAFVRAQSDVIPAVVGSRKGLICCNERKLYPICHQLGWYGTSYGRLCRRTIRRDRNNMIGVEQDRHNGCQPALEGLLEWLWVKGWKRFLHSNLPENASSGKTSRSRSFGFALLRTASARLRLLLTSPTYARVSSFLTDCVKRSIILEARTASNLSSSSQTSKRRCLYPEGTGVQEFRESSQQSGNE
jgi:hypothetical protein